MRRFAILLVSLGLCAAADAQFTINDLGPLSSDGVYDEPENGLILFNYTGAEFVIEEVRFTGTANDNGLGSYASELQVWITDPDGNTAGWGPINARGWSGAQTVTAQSVPEFGFLLEGVPGTWTVQFSESFDEAGLDAYWTDVTIEFVAAVPQATVAASTHPTTTWHRPVIDLERIDGGTVPVMNLSQINPEAAVHAQRFEVAQAGDYVVRSTQAGWDGILYLHSGDFAFNQPIESNLVINDDANAGVGYSQLSATLDADTVYWLLIAGFGPEDGGQFVTRFYGPGAVMLAPEICAGDTDCDSDVDFDDITLFVTAIGDDGTAWVAHHEQLNNHGPLCTFANADLDADGDVDFDDITPFVEAIGTVCFGG